MAILGVRSDSRPRTEREVIMERARRARTAARRERRRELLSRVAPRRRASR
jgi:hypothetical protein